MFKRAIHLCQINASGDGIGVPKGLQALFSVSDPSRLTSKTPGLRLTATHGDHYAMINARLMGASALGPKQFEQQVQSSYRQIADVLAEWPQRRPVRFWNFIPQIHERVEDDLDRYMVFNAGRFHAFESWFGKDLRVAGPLPTATGIGHNGNDLFIHCLATDEQAKAVDNPRQCPAYQYSRRYGPLPPCFARATAIYPKSGEPPLVLVGGTASVRGEDSVHARNLEGQIQETFENPASVVRSACYHGVGDIEPNATDNLDACLDRFEQLRVYYTNPHHVDAIVLKIHDTFPSVEQIELVQADLCRRELLVEIEGVAVGTTGRFAVRGGLP